MCTGRVQKAADKLHIPDILRTGRCTAPMIANSSACWQWAGRAAMVWGGTDALPRSWLTRVGPAGVALAHPCRAGWSRLGSSVSGWLESPWLIRVRLTGVALVHPCRAGCSRLGSSESGWLESAPVPALQLWERKVAQDVHT